jgi:serine/threonine-protein kinase
LANLGRAQGAHFLERPAGAAFAAPPGEPDDDLVGQAVGPYTVEAVLGAGGFGTVYRAARSDGQYRQAVALKVLNPGLGGPAVLRRFRRERQALAGLEGHPHIVALFDAGLAPDGRPYFVMELVDGRPLDQYCDEPRLTILERLGLFQQACSAVQQAHKSLVVHRDLKPANILAGPGPAGGPAVKLLDFGIAKSLAPEPAEDGGAGEGLTTGPGERVFTPAYASPEQVRGQRVDVTSDVYSLGVVLYELLTGHRPYRFGGATVEEVICGAEPEPPSAKVARTETVPGAGGATTELTPEAVSARRSAGPRQLRRLLAGDLDNIALKALQKEPARRYQSADELARDVTAYLEGNPVAARGRPFGYRAGKLARKHWKVLATAAAFVLLLVVGAALSTWQAVRATRAAEAEAVQRRQAELAAEVLESVFRGLNPRREAPDLKGRLEAQMEEAAARLEQEYAGEPLVRARLRDALGEAQLGLGAYAKAVTLSQQALEERRAKLGPDHPDTLESMNKLASAYKLAGQLDRALPLLEQTLAKRQEKQGPDHPDTLISMNNLALAYEETGQLDKAVLLYERTLAKRQAQLGPDRPDTLNSMNNLAGAYQKKGDFAKAERILRASLILRQQKQPDAWTTFHTQSQFGGSLVGQKQYAEAEPLLLAGYEGMKQRQATIPAHAKKYLTESLDRLVQLYDAWGKPEQANEWRQKLDQAKPPTK